MSYWQKLGLSYQIKRKKKISKAQTVQFARVQFRWMQVNPQELKAGIHYEVFDQLQIIY